MFAKHLAHTGRKEQRRPIPVITCRTCPIWSVSSVLALYLRILGISIPMFLLHKWEKVHHFWFTKPTFGLPGWAPWRGNAWNHFWLLQYHNFPHFIRDEDLPLKQNTGLEMPRLVICFQNGLFGAFRLQSRQHVRCVVLSTGMIQYNELEFLLSDLETA